MPCETRLKPKQTISERAEEVRRAVAKLSAGLTNGSIKAVIGPQGAIAFSGFSDQDRDGITDACAYRRLMAAGSVTAKVAIARAEQLAGRRADLQTLASGVHSHDGGKTWHRGH